MKDIIEKARKISIPSKKLQEEKSKIAKLAFSLVHTHASKYSQITSVEFGGSYPKGTWLPKKADIDIFLKFEDTISEEDFVKISKKIGFNSLKKYSPYIRYSEHPYVEAKIQGTKVNVVPCYNVELGNWKSSADRTPFHTKFMLESLTGSMKNEVRLLKNFLICNGVYGSEIAKQAISGYVSEVLILQFGTFEDVIKAIAALKPNETIGKATKKFDTPIVIIDPIDSNRNLGAAISPENVGKLVLICRGFLKRPSMKFFKSKSNPEISKNLLYKVVVVKFSFKPRSPDIIWGQIKKASSSLSTQIELEGFKVLRKNATTDEKKEAWLLFLLQSLKIDKEYVRQGPDIFQESDSKFFVEKNIKKSRLMWIDSSMKILSLQDRKFNDVKLFLKNLLQNNLNRSGIPRGLLNDFKKGFRIMDGKTASKSIKEALSDITSTHENSFSPN